MSQGSYAAPDWDTHHDTPADDSESQVSTMPDHKVHEEFKTNEPASYEPKRGPFDFDMKSVWQRDADDKEDKEKKEENEKEVEGSSSNTKEEIKPPAITPRYPHRTPADIPVNFSKLMSSGYGDEWLHQRDELEKKNSQSDDSETSQPKSTQTYNE